jgi:hypothetical protein
MSEQQAVQVIQLALDVLEGQPMNLNDDEVTALLRQHGLSSDDADRLLALLPIAFGRVTLRQMGVTSFSDDAHVFATGAKPVAIRLSDQPVFAAGVRMGESLYRRTPPSNAFRLLAARSPEVSAMLDVLDAGDSAANSKIASPGFAGYEARLFVKPPWWRRSLF